MYSHVQSFANLYTASGLSMSRLSLVRTFDSPVQSIVVTISFRAKDSAAPHRCPDKNIIIDRNEKNKYLAQAECSTFPSFLSNALIIAHAWVAREYRFKTLSLPFPPIFFLCSGLLRSCFSFSAASL